MQMFKHAQEWKEPPFTPLPAWTITHILPICFICTPTPLTHLFGLEHFKANPRLDSISLVHVSVCISNRQDLFISFLHNHHAIITPNKINNNSLIPANSLTTTKVC